MQLPWNDNMMDEVARGVWLRVAGRWIVIYCELISIVHPGWSWLDYDPQDLANEQAQQKYRKINELKKSKASVFKMSSTVLNELFLLEEA